MANQSDSRLTGAHQAWTRTRTPPFTEYRESNDDSAANGHHACQQCSSAAKIVLASARSLRFEIRDLRTIYFVIPNRFSGEESAFTSLSAASEVVPSLAPTNDRRPGSESKVTRVRQ